MERPAGGFLKLLKSKQKAMKPAGDTDPIPEDWKEDKEEMDEAAIEAAWETKCEATPGIGMDENAKGGDMGGQEDEAYDEEEEEEGGDANDDDVGDDDEVCEVQDDENDDEESADKMKQEDTSDDKGQQHEMEYEEMDKDRKKLAEFLTNEKKRKLSPGKETKDDDAGQSWHQHRNKGYGNGYGKQKGNYQHGWGRNWWPKGKGKGKHKNRDGGTNGSGATLKTGNGMGAKAAHLPIQGEGHQLSYVRTTRVDTTCHTVRGTSMLR